MLRFASRFAASGFCLLSLLACLAAGWLWSGGGDGEPTRFRLRWHGAGYTVLAGRRLELRAIPAGPVDGEARAGELARRMRNDDVRWAAATILPDPLQFPTTRNDSRATADEPGRVAQELAARFSLEELRRPLLESVEDPGRFVAAHAVLVDAWRKSMGRGEERGSVLSDSGDRGPFIVGYDGLQLELPPAGPPRRFAPAAGGLLVRTEGQGRARDLADRWQDRLEVPAVTTGYGTIMVATALAPLLWLGVRTRRAMALRRRERLGLCPNCSYDLRGSPGSGRCSECGQAVPGSTTRVRA